MDVETERRKNNVAGKRTIIDALQYTQRPDDVPDVGTLLVFPKYIVLSVPVGFLICFPCTCCGYEQGEILFILA